MLLVNPRKETGSITAIAVMMLVVFGVLLAGLLPFTKEVGRSAAASTELLSAQYVAEAGIKRALVGFLKDRSDWATWLGKPFSLANGSWSSDTYEVSISPEIKDGNPAEGGKEYTITAVGRAGGRSQKVSCKVILPTITRTVITRVPETGTLVANLPNDTIYIGGDLWVKNNFEVNGDVVCGGKIFTHSGKSIGGSGARLTNQNGMQFPAYDLDKYNGFKTAASALPTATSNNQSLSLDGDLYYVDGNLNIDKEGTTYNFSKPTIIFVENDVQVSANNLQMNGPVMIIALGRIYGDGSHGGNNMTMSNGVLVAGGGVDFENSNNLKIGGQVVTKGNLNLKNNDKFTTAESNLADTFNKLTKAITIWKETQTTETGKDFAHMSIRDWNMD